MLHLSSLQITGFTLPTSFAWDDAGHVFVSEKGGKVKMASSFDATNTTVILDITSVTETFGDHGLTVSSAVQRILPSLAPRGSFADIVGAVIATLYVSLCRASSFTTTSCTPRIW
jgi:DNA-binding beta-propeller fold protein YncE